MVELLSVRGSQENVPLLEVNKDTVYIRSNVKRIETEDFTGWEYDEKQLTISEYLEMLGNKIL